MFVVNNFEGKQILINFEGSELKLGIKDDIGKVSGSRGDFVRKLLVSIEISAKAIEKLRYVLLRIGLLRATKLLQDATDCYIVLRTATEATKRYQQ